MDTGKGYFEQIQAENKEALESMKRDIESKHPNHGGWFRPGEEVELKGSRFRVKRITPNEIVLKLLERGSNVPT